MPCPNCVDGLCQQKCAPVGPKMKTCTTCDKSKPLTEFYRSASSSDGRKPRCKECSNAKVREYKQTNSDKINEQNREAIANKRREALIALGNECTECGHQDLRVLQIDHVNGGGNQDRKTRSRWAIFTDAIENPSKYQLLCANCHCIKCHENGEYAHARK